MNVTKIIEKNINKKLEEVQLRRAIIENIVAMYGHKYNTEEKIIELCHNVDNSLCGVNSIIELFDEMCMNLEESF